MFLGGLPNFTASYEDYLDSDGIRTTLAYQGHSHHPDDELAVDFNGTAPCLKGAIYRLLKPSPIWGGGDSQQDPLHPYGPMQRDIPAHPRTVPDGTLLNARIPSQPEASGEVAYRAIFTVIGALAQVVPEHVCGADYGAINHCYITTRQRDRPSIFYAYPPGRQWGDLYDRRPQRAPRPVLGRRGLAVPWKRWRPFTR